MKTTLQKTAVLVFLFSFAIPTTVFAELKPLLSEKGPWSVVHNKPTAKNWTMTYPLPNDRKVRGALDTEDGTWPKEKKYVYMTAELELPEDYKPGNLFVQYRHDDSVQIAINGTLVIQRIGCGNQWDNGVGIVYTKRVPNLLKPGKNIIAAFCENYAGPGYISVALVTDDEPYANDIPLFALNGPWSVTFDNPGENWTMKSQLPGGKKGLAPFSTSTGGGWPGNKKSIWMTRVVTLPKDYKPGSLHAELFCLEKMWVYINGKEVLYRSSKKTWESHKNITNPLQPGENIIAVRCDRWVKEGYVGLDLWLGEEKEGDDSGFSMPTRPAGPAEEEPETQDLTEAEKLIEKGMNFLKQGTDKQALAMFQEAVKADPEDWQANCILGMLYLTKAYKPADAYKCMQQCIKITRLNPCVVNNYAVAAMEVKKYDEALNAWTSLAKDQPTLPELVQNIGFFTLLTDNNKIKLKDTEQKKLEKLYRDICGTRDAKVDNTAGFLLMPPEDGVGNRPDCAGVFVQEYKRDKQTVQGKSYEVKRTYFQR